MERVEWYPLRGDGRALWGKPFFADAWLNAELASVPGALWRAENGVRYLALPYADDRPFPLTALFCFARLAPVCGQRRVVYCVDEAGWPILAPHADR